MAIYTCLDMIRDCRADKSEGWSYLITRYVPLIRFFLKHYYPNEPEFTDSVRKAIFNKDSSLWATTGIITEREFVASLRQEVLRLYEQLHPVLDSSLDLEIITAAFESLTLVDRQLVWFETMDYPSDVTAKLMNLELSSVEGARSKADELLRQNMDNWTKGMIGKHGRALGAIATAAHGERCIVGRAFLEMIDGRITWSSKKDYEFHINQCWFCVDHFCRIREVDFALSKTKAMTDEEAAPLRKIAGLPEPKRSLWERLGTKK